MNKLQKLFNGFNETFGNPPVLVRKDVLLLKKSETKISPMRRTKLANGYTRRFMERLIIKEALSLEEGCPRIDELIKLCLNLGLTETASEITRKLT